MWRVNTSCPFRTWRHAGSGQYTVDIVKKKKSFQRVLSLQNTWTFVALVHGLQWWHHPNCPGSCFWGHSTWMNGSSKGPSSPLLPSNTHITEHNLKLFCFLQSLLFLLPRELLEFAANAAGFLLTFHRNGKTQREKAPILSHLWPWLAQTCQARRAPHESRAHKPQTNEYMESIWCSKEMKVFGFFFEGPLV